MENWYFLKYTILKVIKQFPAFPNFFLFKSPICLPRGWTPLRQYTTDGLCVVKISSSLLSFCSPSYFSANGCFFACVSLYIPVLPFSPALPSILRTFQYFCHALPLPKSSWACRLEVPPPTYFYISLPVARMYFLFLQHYLIPYFPCLSRNSTPKIFWACPLRVPPPAYFLPFSITLPSPTSMYCGFYLDYLLLCP